MSVAKILEKLGKDLTAGEREELTQWATKISSVESAFSSWVIPGTTTPNFNFPMGVVSEVIFDTTTASWTVNNLNQYSVKGKHLFILGSGKLTGGTGMNP